MKETMLVDGYNLIYAWPDLVALKEYKLEHARDKLADILANYGAFSGVQVILVYDAHLVPGPVSKEMIKNLEVVFTEEGETADSYIERMSYELVHSGYRVFVVTSDRAEQFVVLGAGAMRLSCRELREQVVEAQKEIKDRIDKQHIASKRHEIGNRLKEDIANKLDAMRKGIKKA